ncbi:hypothetical protein Fokcrypt_00111 [Candidatus Fokinia cryptica]|uniref:Uncharacterized protein n=1 Tax=Candidatus Fokinia crypta TaxID=1920990 RepID=A0ABZ0URU3_9RICK|nr:hypothetical protein Fokcrypt_00111 [Candidatus Fokinia cryptica]
MMQRINEGHLISCLFLSAFRDYICVFCFFQQNNRAFKAFEISNFVRYKINIFAITSKEIYK